MPSAFDDNAQDVGMSLDVIESEIRAGLVLHADRLSMAYDNEEFYACRNQAYIPRRESEEWRDYLKRPKRTSKLTRKVIATLAKGLYSPGPTRRLKDGAAADAFLQGVYEQNHINALMKRADRLATLNGFAAIQAHATGRPAKPVLLTLWGAHECVVWTWPGDQTEAWAVVTIVRETQSQGSTQSQRLRYEAFSRDEHRVYLTKWFVAPAPQSYDYLQTRYRGCFGREAFFTSALSGSPAGSGKNPYGVLPFSFCHNEAVVSDFYAGGLGDPLRDCNAEIDRELSDLAQHVHEFTNPDRFLFGVSSSWRREKKIDRWQLLPPGKDAEGEAADPRAELVQATLEVESVWENASRYANLTLEELDVPLVAVHSDVSTDLSGIAIVAKHIPLLERTLERQPLFAVAECELASMVLMVGGMSYAADDPDGALATASEECALELTWPPPTMPLPTPERDAADKFEMDEGISSLVGVVAKRHGFTIEQSKEAILEVIEQNKWLKSVMPPPETLDALGNVVDPNAVDDPKDPKTKTEPDQQQDD